MGCGGGKAAAVGVHDPSNPKKESLPASLSKSAAGRFQSALPPICEGRRDFARIFFANERKIFVVAPGMPSMRPIQPTTGPSSAHIGDMSEQVVERAVALFTESLSIQLSQAFGGVALEEQVFRTLIDRAIASMTVNIAIDFALQMKLLPMFMQPAFLIVLLGDPVEARAATYGFVAETPQQISGDRPESKRTPFCVRLLSPNLLEPSAAGGAGEPCNKWEVQYSAMAVHTSTITQVLEMDMPKVREAIHQSRWDPLHR
mmetsp:Transcript_112829/g.325956  ORF Transcript_112829/g.325956 Transcript_112829/m.325956 type:complete len:259 (+) Transcript_112829:71-847(+)